MVYAFIVLAFLLGGWSGIAFAKYRILAAMEKDNVIVVDKGYLEDLLKFVSEIEKILDEVEGKDE